MKDLAIICDLDGTLAVFNGRGPFEMEKCDTDILNLAVYVTLHSLAAAGYSVILVSGRFEQYRPQTEAWLDKHKVPWQRLHLRADGDYRKDKEIKRELYEREIRPHHTVLLSLDDRNQSVECWRELGIPCFQVAPGDF